MYVTMVALPADHDFKAGYIIFYTFMTLAYADLCCMLILYFE